MYTHVIVYTDIMYLYILILLLKNFHGPLFTLSKERYALIWLCYVFIMVDFIHNSSGLFY